MTDVNSLLAEAEKLGILNIDVDGSQISPEVIQAAIDATKNLKTRLDNNEIIKKLQEADSVVAAHYR
jgi:hypothetical protein